MKEMIIDVRNGRPREKRLEPLMVAALPPQSTFPILEADHGTRNVVTALSSRPADTVFEVF